MWKERVVGKAAGDECVFIPGEGPDWQMRLAATPMPDTAGGEGGHGAAKPQGVIHRYRIYPEKIRQGMLESSIILCAEPQPRRKFSNTNFFDFFLSFRHS
jgi:hypothetical protein